MLLVMLFTVITFIFQAVCKDKIFPKIHVFAKGYGASDNPRRAYVLAYFIGLAFICIGQFLFYLLLGFFCFCFFFHMIQPFT